MAKPNKTRYAVLGMLSMQPSSGYEIKKMMEQSTDHFWREGDSSIYPILKQLLEEGMLTCEVGNAESDKPKKNICDHQRRSKRITRLAHGRTPTLP